MTRKQLIEALATDLYTIKNKVHSAMAHNHQESITYAQQFALSIISQYENAGIKEIASMLCVSSSAATQLVNELVKHGFARRQTNATDRRALDLAITKKGNQQIARAKKARLATMVTVFSALTNKELQNLVTLHKKIISTL